MSRTYNCDDRREVKRLLSVRRKSYRANRLKIHQPLRSEIIADRGRARYRFQLKF